MWAAFGMSAYTHKRKCGSVNGAHGFLGRSWLSGLIVNVLTLKRETIAIIKAAPDSVGLEDVKKNRATDAHDHVHQGTANSGPL